MLIIKSLLLAVFFLTLSILAAPIPLDAGALPSKDDTLFTRGRAKNNRDGKGTDFSESTWLISTIIPAGNNDDGPSVQPPFDEAETRKEEKRKEEKRKRKLVQNKASRLRGQDIISQRVLWLITDDFIIALLGKPLMTPGPKRRREILICQRLLGQ